MLNFLDQIHLLLSTVSLNGLIFITFAVALFLWRARRAISSARRLKFAKRDSGYKSITHLRTQFQDNQNGTGVLTLELTPVAHFSELFLKVKLTHGGRFRKSIFKNHPPKRNALHRVLILLGDRLFTEFNDDSYWRDVQYGRPHHYKAEIEFSHPQNLRFDIEIASGKVLNQMESDLELKKHFPGEGLKSSPGKTRHKSVFSLKAYTLEELLALD